MSQVTVDYAPPAQKRKRSRLPLIVGGAAAAAVAVVVGVTQVPDDTTAPAPKLQEAPAAPAPKPAPEPEVPVSEDAADVVAARLAGTEKLAADEAGAVTAAATYLSAYGSNLMYQPDTRTALLDGMLADEGVSSEYVKSIDKAFTEGIGRLGLTADGEAPAGLAFHSRELVLGTDVVDLQGPSKKHPSPRATVEVWHGGLVGMTGDASPRPVSVAWTTTSVDLLHDGTTWRWVEHSDTDGPVPASELQTPSGSDDLEDALTGTEEPGYVG